MFDNETFPTCNLSVTRDMSQSLANFDTSLNCGSDSAFEGPEKLLEVWFAPNPNACPPGVKKNGLKSVHVQKWKEMLNLVNCKILSVIETEHVDAYLLSESSMFVFPHKLILKTCGTTTLLFGLSRILSIAFVDAGFPKNEKTATDKVYAIPYRVFYSRKKFLFPDKQQGPHRCWENEVEFLDNIFEGGSAYMVGKVNGDHWYLYLTLPNTSILTPCTTGDTIKNKNLRIQSNPLFPDSLEHDDNNDETLEILMTDLDQENAKKFYVDHASTVATCNISGDTHEKLQDTLNSINGSSEHIKYTEQLNRIEFSMSQDKRKFNLQSQLPHSGFLTPPKETLDDTEIAQGHALGTFVTETCGLLEVFPKSEYPNARVDSHLFSPCGLSVNGIFPAVDDTSAYYFTVHVTPEPHCSYASFESNVPIRRIGRDTADVVQQVVNIFKPGRFSVTLFEANADSSHILHDPSLLQNNMIRDQHDKKNRYLESDKIKGYDRTDRIIHQFEGYNLVFRSYERDNL
ncbi:S-adenosylmethionine decarboxylase proenzyme [Erysiphe neolycopersici]|uniref:adenosylmethionine decarboxylase n=1 Tax=Erysiphe neolycopersici TaxID=212602 RepID=A0A420HJC8_9PEZI|nr:S-adenosylmethionine decarboxylase proenzyme [Erysiphe neolycopersici]